MALYNKNLKETQNTKPPKWFYLILLLIPILFFILLEILLNVFNYGKEYVVFIHNSKSYPDKLFLNNEITSKYFPNLKESPGTVADAFDEVKKDNTFRIFVLGGSSTAGWPYPPNGSFPRYLKRRLELLYPENTIEVINCGISAINTYTIRDIVPEIIKYKPDLILIYAGHNEYYGALGVGSSASITNSRWINNTYIWLQKYKTFQLTQNLINWIHSLFNQQDINDKNVGNETLMARMIGESLIPFGSEEFNSGIEQFKGNMNDVLQMFYKENIPVIIATLTSNIRELKPFVSTDYEDFPAADKVFEKAKKELDKKDTVSAKKFFIQAKELDALRFRAPEEINKIIKELANKYDLNFIDIDSIFNSQSPFGIVGYNLTVDHLHPTLEGYCKIGKEFFLKMHEKKLLPSGKKLNISFEKQDSLMGANIPFTALDSVISNIQLLTLIGSYPFVPKGYPNKLIERYKINNFIDSLAYKVLNRELLWEVAHAKAAEFYFSEGKYNLFMKEMDAIIHERTFVAKSYKYAAQKLIDANLHNDALNYLYPLYKIESTYFTNKWIGQIELNNKNYSLALKYLEEACKFNEADWQTWYNLAGAYYFNNNIEKAINAIKISLDLNSANPLANNLYKQLIVLSNKKG